jgi:hypothetical protein
MIAIGVGVDPVSVNRTECRPVPADRLDPRDRAARRPRLVGQSAREVGRYTEEGASGSADPRDGVRGAPEQVLVAIGEFLQRQRRAVVDADGLGKVVGQCGSADRLALRPKNGDSKLSTLTLDGVTFAAWACAPPIEAKLAAVKTEID